MGGAACAKIILCGPPVQHRAERIVNQAELALQGHLPIADYAPLQKVIECMMKAERLMEEAEKEWQEACGIGY